MFAARLGRPALRSWRTNRLFGMFRGKPPIRDASELSRFIDENAAFLVQKGVYEYSRARAGHYAKVLFAEQPFLETVEQSRWRAYPLGLAMVAEMTEGALRPHADGGGAIADSLAALVLAVFDGYPVPAALGRDTWLAARGDRPTSRPRHDASAQTCHRYSRALCQGIFRPDANPRKAARRGFFHPAQLFAGHPVQHP